MDKKMLLVGTISNVSKTLEKELQIVLQAISIFKSVEVFLVESDSTDETVKILEKIQANNSSFNYVALGTLKEKYPNRIDRIAYCRNIYVDYIRKNYLNHQWEYTAVADLDGMNFKLNKRGIISCFKEELYWDGIFANQKYGYYDLLALRADGWLEQDYYIEISATKKNNQPTKHFRNKLLNFFINFIFYDRIRKKIIYKRMKVIPRKEKLIKVKSAFGGFGIYKTECFMSHKYIIDSTKTDRSEHVKFHESCSKDGKIFYINPALINANFNVYNKNKLWLVRFIREYRKRNLF